MKRSGQLEYWLRGPVAGVPPLLQPVAHALLQARDEVNRIMEGFPADRLWERPAGVAAVGFHLRHLTGVLDRLLTYARGEALNQEQLEYLAGEGVPGPEEGRGYSEGVKGAEEGRDHGAGLGGMDTPEQLLDTFNLQIDKALEQISATLEGNLTAVRFVGRGRVPSTVGGLLFHAAEHTMRHTGQLLVTVKILGNPYEK